jgi:hypothetical protein
MKKPRIAGLFRCMAERYREKELGCYSRKSEVIKNITAKAPDNTIGFSTAGAHPQDRRLFFNGNVELTAMASRAENPGYTPLSGSIRR